MTYNRAMTNVMPTLEYEWTNRCGIEPLLHATPRIDSIIRFEDDAVQRFTTYLEQTRSPRESQEGP